MSFSMSPIGIGIVVLIHLAVLAVFPFVWHRFPQGTVKRLVIFAAVMFTSTAATTWDAFIVGYNKERYCKEAGVRVYRQVAVEGFYAHDRAWDEQSLVQSGYRYVEYRDYMDKKTLYRIERIGDEVRKTKIDRPLSRYHLLPGITGHRTYRSALDGRLIEEIVNADTTTYLNAMGVPVYDMHVSYLVRMGRGIVLDTQTRTVVGEHRSYYLYPPWVDRLWLGLFDNPETQCHGPLGQSPSLTNTVLIPAR